MPPDLLRQMERLVDVDKWAPDILRECGQIFADELKANLAAHHVTYDLIKSIGVQKPKKNKVWSVTVLNSKAKSETGRNALKLAELEYGNSNQGATPVVAPARAKAEKEVKEVIEYWLENYG